jgi:hypothetical protein
MTQNVGYIQAVGERVKDLRADSNNQVKVEYEDGFTRLVINAGKYTTKKELVIDDEFTTAALKEITGWVSEGIATALIVPYGVYPTSKCMGLCQAILNIAALDPGTKHSVEVIPYDSEGMAVDCIKEER